jgi:hypothetical protein
MWEWAWEWCDNKHANYVSMRMLWEWECCENENDMRMRIMSFRFLALSCLLICQMSRWAVAGVEVSSSAHRLVIYSLYILWQIVKQNFFLNLDSNRYIVSWSLWWLGALVLVKLRSLTVSIVLNFTFIKNDLSKGGAIDVKPGSVIWWIFLWTVFKWHARLGNTLGRTADHYKMFLIVEH